MSALLRSVLLAESTVIKKASKILNSLNNKQQKRNLNVHEHISYSLLQEAGICVPSFGLAKTKEEAKKIATDLNTKDLVIKAQVLTGGRGVGKFKNGLKGGVRMVYSPEEAEETAEKMLGQYLVTKQSGPEGKICNSVMVTERKFTRREYYFSVMMERSYNGPVVIASSQGGVSIEDVAVESPEAIIYEPVDIQKGLSKEQAECIAEKVGLHSKKEETAEMLLKMYKLFIEKDALLIEINPYAEDTCESYFALDAKFRFDDNSAFRQKELHAKRDWSQEDIREAEAAKFDLNYVALDGSIGCMVNGAGLAMATMDIISLHGGTPANFLDVGGGANATQVKEAFKIITSDPRVFSILVNIFGGIMKCDIIAEGIIAAAKELNLTMPIICRLQGTNVDKAKEMISKSGMKIIPMEKLDDAAKLSVKLANIVKMAKEASLEVKFQMNQ